MTVENIRAVLSELSYLSITLLLALHNPLLFDNLERGHRPGTHLRGPAFSGHYVSDSAAGDTARRAYSLGLSPLRAR